MLRIKVEILPLGLEDGIETIGEIEIANTVDHPQRPEYGNYDVRLRSEFRNLDIRIEDHRRLDGWIPLLKKIMEKA